MKLKRIKSGTIVYCKNETDFKTLKDGAEQQGYSFKNVICNTNDYPVYIIFTGCGDSDKEALVRLPEYITNHITLAELMLSSEELIHTLGECCNNNDDCRNCPLSIYKGNCCIINNIRRFDKHYETAYDICVDLYNQKYIKKDIEDFWEVKCLENSSYHTTEHYTTEEEAWNMAKILAEKDENNTYYAVHVCKVKKE